MNILNKVSSVKLNGVFSSDKHFGKKPCLISKIGHKVNLRWVARQVPETDSENWQDSPLVTARGSLLA